MLKVQPSLANWRRWDYMASGVLLQCLGRANLNVMSTQPTEMIAIGHMVAIQLSIGVRHIGE
jgi:hypothetical protein